MTAIETTKSWAKIVNPTAGERAGEVVAVIDIYREMPSVKPENQENPKRSHNQEVDHVALKIAQDFYEQCQKEITATTRRNDLEKIFRNFCEQPEREFAVVLYALAKGMKVVNVFERGASLEWHKFNPSVINRTKRSLKKPTTSNDGWTTKGQPPVAKEYQVEPAKFQREETHVPSLPEAVIENEPLSMDEIIQTIAQSKAEIKELDNEIESLLNFRREHLGEINRVQEISNKDLGAHLKGFHEHRVIDLESLLDSIQAEINSKKEIQSRYCDMLKQ
jgi:hypothetical protein